MEYEDMLAEVQSRHGLLGVMMYRVASAADICTPEDFIKICGARDHQWVHDTFETFKEVGLLVDDDSEVH